jgi:hypothetical protein
MWRAGNGVILDGDGALPAQHEAAIWTGRLMCLDDESTSGASSGLTLAQGRAARNAGALTHRVGASTILANNSLQSLREFLAGAGSARCLLQHPPNALRELQIFNILGKIVEPSHEVPWIG